MNPEAPFQPGQTIVVPKLTAEMRRWVTDGLAALVEEPEAAVLGDPPEMATVGRSKGRGSRA